MINDDMELHSHVRMYTCTYTSMNTCICHICMHAHALPVLEK